MPTFFHTKSGAPVAGNRAFTPAGIATAAASRGIAIDPRRFSAEAAVNAQGQVNASDVRDLMRIVGNLALAASVGEATQINPETVADHKAVIAEALEDKTGAGWLAIGEIVGTQVVETMGRQGFARRLMQSNPLAKGDIARVRMRHRDIAAVVSTTDPNVVANQVRQPVVYPSFFSIIANILIEDMEINMDSGDLLEERYQDGLEQMMVVEDRSWLTFANTAANMYNPLVMFPTLTPSAFQLMKNNVESWGGTPVTSAVISFDLWNDIVAEPEFTAWYSELEKHELAVEGSLGKLMGVEIITDGYRLPKLKVLDQGQIYMTSSPATLGVISQLGDLNVKPIDQYSIGNAKRGWYMSQTEAMALVNPKAIIRGQKA